MGELKKEERMAVYVDQAIWAWHGRKWCHLVADDIDELHRFAHVLGLHRSSYQGPPKTGSPHYDLTSYERRRALARGALACDRTGVVMIVRKLRRQAAAQDALT
jgi:hypothetical protein